MPGAIHLDLDGAWPESAASLTVRNLRAWGPRLRYCAPAAEVDAFDREVGDDLPPYILYGSGDFHYLAALWVRRASARLAQSPGGELTVVSFDNHPDWDVRPPRWACGGWICRALELPRVRRASVWGCGNFELTLPSRLFANRAALSDGRLEIDAWAERQKPAVQRRFDCMTRSDWRQRFERFAAGLAGADLYITVDLDCLRAEEAVTNWENGLFEAGEIASAIRRLREAGHVVGGDLCGAWSQPQYARWRQRFAGNWDHPRLPPRDPVQGRAINAGALAVIWPALTGAEDGN